MQASFLSDGICFGVLMIPVILSAYCNLVVDLGEMFDRSKDKPALIRVSAVVGIRLTLTFLFVGDLLSNFVVRGCCAFLIVVPKVGVRLPFIVIDLMSEFALLSLHVMISNESDDDLMMVNTSRSFVC